MGSCKLQPLQGNAHPLFSVGLSRSSQDGKNTDARAWWTPEDPVMFLTMVQVLITLLRPLCSQDGLLLYSTHKRPQGPIHNTPTPKRAGMSPEELQRHYREGICFHCHKAGHLTRVFPKKNPAPIFLAQINASSQSYKFILISVNVKATLQRLKTFIDTEADKSFIDADLAQELGLSAYENCLQIIMGNSTNDKGYKSNKNCLWL
ncbi:hypothetical protein DSO57_1006456 [Entomophthora muscae]|uniref:Uncharacterized protein n=1 Tax=Entomophthora muscae TaxID=34485 RepID=A0ACC2UUN0_9FUNG|nr:hypothetical protein DSO57_1006456 [Entomophthora muscae]